MSATHQIRTSEAWDGQWYCSVAKLFPHTYGSRSAFGKRTVMKPGAGRDLGKHPDRKAALKAGREFIALATGKAAE